MKKMTYESGLAELNAIIEKIEDGELTLEETIKAYEKGNQLANKLTEMLEEGKGRVLQLQKDGSETPFDGGQEA